MIELFAGVGGFRIGFNRIKSFNKDGKAFENGPWKFVWANQWEPSTKSQHAFDCYNLRFPEKKNNSNIDISKVDRKTIPNHSVLVGGFPCQDYSVAHSLKNEKGIEGKKGVLWWEINDILKAKHTPFVLLENVDRLLKSPAKQRGQAFGIILRCFADLGYGVQWRVINAAEYGHPQKRRRTFIFAFHKSTKYFNNFKNTIKFNENDVLNETIFNCFPSTIDKTNKTSIANISKKKYKTVADVSENFHFDFKNSGLMLDYKIMTTKLISTYKGKIKSLRECLDCKNVPSFCYKTNVKKFEYLKGAKKIERTALNGHKYFYSEGPVPFPDKLDNPARTMLTSEGTINRSSHLILDPFTKKYRILTPIECERLDEFPDNWTKTGMPEKRRYFMMGNALVTGLITTISKSVEKIIEKEN